MKRDFQKKLKKEIRRILSMPKEDLLKNEMSEDCKRLMPKRKKTACCPMMRIYGRYSHTPKVLVR